MDCWDHAIGQEPCVATLQRQRNACPKRKDKNSAKIDISGAQNTTTVARIRGKTLNSSNLEVSTAQRALPRIQEDTEDASSDILHSTVEQLFDYTADQFQQEASRIQRETEYIILERYRLQCKQLIMSQQNRDILELIESAIKMNPIPSKDRGFKKDLIHCNIIVGTMSEFTQGKSQFITSRDCPTGPLLEIVELTENAPEDLQKAIDIISDVSTTIGALIEFLNLCSSTCCIHIPYVPTASILIRDFFAKPPTRSPSSSQTSGVDKSEPALLPCTPSDLALISQAFRTLASEQRASSESSPSHLLSVPLHVSLVQHDNSERTKLHTLHETKQEHNNAIHISTDSSAPSARCDPASVTFNSPAPEFDSWTLVGHSKPKAKQKKTIIFSHARILAQRIHLPSLTCMLATLHGPL